MTGLRKMAALLLAVALLTGGVFAARAQETAADGSGAFGESIDGLSDETRALVYRCVDRARRQLLKDYGEMVTGYEGGPERDYVKILHTTVYLPEQWPSGATELETALWNKYYQRFGCVVSFVALGNLTGQNGAAPYAEVLSQFDGYVFLYAGNEIERFSLRTIRSQMFANPVPRGVRVIDLGDAENGVYAVPPEPQAGVPLLDYLDDPALLALARNFERDFPVSVSVRHDGLAGGTPVTSTDPETVRAVFTALKNITVLDEWPFGGHTDDYLFYYFTMADGSTVFGVPFQDRMLLDGWMGLYEITGFDALMEALPDPGF